MQTVIDLDDVSRNFSQFILWKRFLDVRVYRFVAVGLQGKLLQVDDGHAQFMGKAIKHADKYHTDDDGKPDVMRVGTERLNQADIVGQCGTDNDVQFRIVSCRIEEFSSHAFRLAMDGISTSLLQGLLDFCSPQMVLELFRIHAEVVENYFSCRLNQSDAQVVQMMASYVTPQHAGVQSVLLEDEITELVVVVLQLGIQQLYFIFFFPTILKGQEADDEGQEQGYDRKEQPLAEGHDMIEERGFHIGNPLFTFKTITIAQPGNDTFSIFTNFLAKTGDVHVDGTVQYKHFVLPNLGKDVFAREYSPFVLQEE